MKKMHVKNLSLEKKLISKLVTSEEKIKGGLPQSFRSECPGCNTHDPCDGTRR